MSVVSLAQPQTPFNPLDDFEDMIEASGYDYDRATRSRLHFNCSGKQGDYAMMLEWNADVEVIKCSLIIEATQKTDSELLQSAIAQSNETAWHGFFLVDGVGNSIFKSLIPLSDASEEKAMFIIEEGIDSAMKEADRFCVSLALSHNKSSDDLFSQDDYDLENLTLMFSDTKGNA